MSRKKSKINPQRRYIVIYIHISERQKQVIRLLYCIVLYGIVLYCIIRPYTEGPIGPLSYRHSSGVVRNPHSALAE